MKNLSIIIFLLSTLVACDLEWSDSGSDTANNNLTNPETTPSLPTTTPVDGGKTTTAPPMDYSMEVGKRVGLITPDATEADLIEYYGADQVQRREIGLGEGETTEGTVVFPGTDNQLIVEWQEGQTYEKIKSIRIDGENAAWATSQGIRIGTTLETLKTINEKPFQFYGFEWDYAGTANEWQGGKIDPKLTVILNPNRPEAAFPDLLGDQLFSSEHPKAAEADLRVSSMTIAF